jgi:predicted ATPase
MANGSAMPLLLLLDDVQWADVGTLHLLRYVLQRARESHHRLLLVLTRAGDAVDEDAAKVLFELLLTFRRTDVVTSVQLHRLSREQVGEMADGILDHATVSPRSVDSLYACGEGNPFFTAEICKSQSRQALLNTSGDFVWPDQGRGLTVPLSVRSAVMARVARLPEATQAILFMAAVTEGGFRPDVIQQACSMADDTFVAALERAATAQLIIELSNTTTLQYAFAHAQIPVILSDSMSMARLRLYEKRIAAVATALCVDDVEFRSSHRATAG